MQNLRHKAYQVLRGSESFFKTDMVYLAKGSFWLSNAQLVTAIIGLLLAIAFANLVPQDSYGTYKYILSLYGVLGIISLSGLGGALSRAVAKGNEGEFIKSIWLNLRFELLITLVGIIGAVYYYTHGNHVLALSLLIIGIFSPVKDSSELYNAFLSGRKDFRATGILSVLKALLGASWMFLTILVTKNPLLMVFSYFLVHTALSSAFLWWTIKTKRPNSRKDNETTTLAKHTSFMNNFSAFADQIDNVLLFHFLGPVSLAIYNFAQAIPEYLGGFTKNIGSLAMPKYAQADKEVVKDSMYNKSFQVFLFGAAMAAIYVLLAPTFFKLFFPQYLESVKYSMVYSLVLLISGSLPMAFIESQMAIRARYMITIISGVSKILLLIGGIVYFGIWGAIVARILAKLVGLTTAFHFTKRI